MEAPTVTLTPSPMAVMKPSTPEPDNAAADGLSGPGVGGMPREGEPAGRQPSPMKFLYGSGDRPLDGYTIKRGVGRGGFGEVYFAESDAGKEVAMKLIRRNLDVELRGVRHCLNLKHPNLIALYDIRTDASGDDWVIMEYVSGPGAGASSLEDVLHTYPQGMPADQAVGWLRGIAAGVSHLHDNGIVHRDLKPGNIFLDGDPQSGGVVKIGDYGLSKFISCSRRSGQTESVGTVHYMAPEIANGRYGREIDTYALGIILYEMLTGRVPFEGESIGEVLMKHLTAEPDLERLEEPYREIVRRALAKDPEVRLRSVGEMMAMLPTADGTLDGADGAAASDATPVIPLSLGPGAEAPAGPAYAPAAAAPVAAGPGTTLEEPLYKAVRQSFSSTWDWWVGMHPVLRVMVLIGGLVAASSLSWVLGPLLLIAGGLYAIHYVLWVTVVRPSLPAPAAPAVRATRMSSAPTAHMPMAAQAVGPLPENARPAPPRQERHRMAAQARRMRLNWREAARKQVAARSTRAKVTEVIGSMLTASVLCIAASVIAGNVMGSGVIGDSNTASASVISTWLAVVTTLGAWAVLITGKLTEGRFEDQAPMRFSLLALGAGVGLAAALFGAGVALPVNTEPAVEPGDTLSYELFAFQRDHLPAYDEGSVAPAAAITVPYFATLFLLLRWWRQAEFIRERRLSVWTVFGVMIVAWLLHLVFWFPQPIGVLIAATVSIATQLSSPWMPPSKREALAAGGVV
ncbi:MAG: serine/threonine-protein kinase [Planctomycetota bacterium]